MGGSLLARSVKAALGPAGMLYGRLVEAETDFGRVAVGLVGETDLVGAEPIFAMGAGGWTSVPGGSEILTGAVSTVSAPSGGLAVSCTTEGTCWTEFDGDVGDVDVTDWIGAVAVPTVVETCPRSRAAAGGAATVVATSSALSTRVRTDSDSLARTPRNRSAINPLLPSVVPVGRPA
jgi:hypothetical protein